MTTRRSLTSLLPAFKQYLETSTQLASSTRKRYLYEVEVFARHVEDRPLDQIAPSDLLEWHQMLISAGAHAYTIQQKHSALKCFLRYLDDFLEDEQAAKLLRAMRRLKNNAPREPTREKWSLDREQEQKMLDAASRFGDDRGLRDRAMLHFLFATGGRRAEVVGLELARLDVDGRLADLLGKGSKWRTVAFDAACQQDLRAWLARRTEWIEGLQQDEKAAARLARQAVFITVSGRAMTNDHFGKLVKQIAKEAGIRKDFWTHLTRHTFITDKLRGGTPITTVSLWVGHADPATTLGYVAESRETIREEYDEALRREASGKAAPPDGTAAKRRFPRGRSRRGA